MAAERLQKILARSGVASRRGAEELIRAGRVAVNGEIAAIGSSANPAVDRIELDGAPLPHAEEALHFAVHKPRGLVSSTRDERGRRSVLGLLRGETDARLWPAGRLDVESEGLMIVTNDGGWANRVLHPRYGTVREYAALVDPPPGPAEIDRLLAGVDLADGPARLRAAATAEPPDAVDRHTGERGAWLRVEIAEGRKREVRRLFEAVGCRVERLVRTRFGPITLDGLHAGAWRRLEPDEVAALVGGDTP